MENSFDILIIGAGAAGLMAALELSLAGRKVAVIEARDRLGGRINTHQDAAFTVPVELGAEFVHGNLEQTQRLLKKVGTPIIKITGNIWQHENGHLEEQEDFIEDYEDLEKKFKNLRADISVEAFISTCLQDPKYEELRFTLTNYVQGYYAADTAKASTYALREELTTSDDEQYRTDGGYKTLVDYLFAETTLKGVIFYRSQVVQRIAWSRNEVTVHTTNKIFTAHKVIITVPLGVLQSGSITFSPAIPEKMEAAHALGFGGVIKVLLQFNDAFWKNKALTGNKDLSDLGFLFSGEKVPTWWTAYPKDDALLTGWLAGPHAARFQHDPDDQVLEHALESLSSIFSVEKNFLRQSLSAWKIANWNQDPFSCGGYAYEVVDGDRYRETLLQPEQDTLYFAGEALHSGPAIGTVEAALVTGRETAHKVIASFAKLG